MGQVYIIDDDKDIDDIYLPIDQFMEKSLSPQKLRSIVNNMLKK